MNLTEENIQLLIQYDQILHNWGRIIGDVGKRYIPAKNDDSHTNFIFNAKTNQLEGRPFSTPSGNYFIAFNIKRNSFVFYELDSITEVASISVSQAYFHIIKQMQNILVDLGITQSNCPEVIEFKHSQHFDIDGYIPEVSKETKELWITLRDGANRILGEALKTLNIESEVRIWPTNFDTGVFYNYNNGYQQWVGLASADDEVINVPYFYTAISLNGKKISPENFEDLNNGYWAYNEWKGAVLPINNFENMDEFLKATSSFIVESTNKLLNHKSK